MSITPIATSDELLATADALHDDEPPRALALLREVRVEALSEASLPRLAFLLAHVLGEKFGLWPEALRSLVSIVDRQGDGVTPYVLRHAAIAAQAADDVVLADRWTRWLATRAQAPLDAAQTLIALGYAAFTISAHAAHGAGQATLKAVSALDTVAASGLDGAFGAVLNNLATELLERPLADFDAPELCHALDEAAGRSLAFWRRGGSWLNVERAHYLAAMGANVRGDARIAATHARAGLALLDAHPDDPEDVDRACLELELSVAYRQAGRSGQAEGAAALDRADALAARFSEPGLDGWFARRRARGDAILAHRADG